MKLLALAMCFGLPTVHAVLLGLDALCRMSPEYRWWVATQKQQTERHRALVRALREPT